MKSKKEIYDMFYEYSLPSWDHFKEFDFYYAEEGPSISGHGREIHLIFLQKKQYWVRLHERRECCNLTCGSRYHWAGRMIYPQQDIDPEHQKTSLDLPDYNLVTD